MLGDLLARHRRKLLVLAGILLVTPMALQAVGGEEKLVVAANAHQRNDAMSVLVSTERGLISHCSGDATVEVSFQGITVYSGVFGKVDMSGCQGTLEIPYSKFASSNGLYLVEATYDGKTAQTRVDVQKVVNWVLVRSFPQEDEERTRIDVAFNQVLGRPLTSSIFSSGTLVLDVSFERCSQDSPLDQLPVTPPQEDCRARSENVFHAEIPVDSEASTHVFLPWENLAGEDGSQAEEGWYNVTATFHNDEARGNSNVPMDPTVYNEDPPGNWFEVAYQ